jgi:hypothetical protein
MEAQQEKKSCPMCGEDILAVAIKCQHCGEWLSKPSSRHHARTRGAPSRKVIAVMGLLVLAAGGLTGVTRSTQLLRWLMIRQAMKGIAQGYELCLSVVPSKVGPDGQTLCEYARGGAKGGLDAASADPSYCIACSTTKEVFTLYLEEPKWRDMKQVRLEGRAALWAAMGVPGAELTPAAIPGVDESTVKEGRKAYNRAVADQNNAERDRKNLLY